MRNNISVKDFMKEGKIMKKFLMSSACVLALGMTNAQAQSMDYGSLQDLFGEPVTTSANGSPMRASDAPMDMTIISAEEIARFPAREIPDILRHYAGVSVRQNTTTDYTVGIRGYNSPGNERLLVLVNGRQMYQDYYGIVNWSLIPVEISEIQQIEVVRGPNTALFGFNATSGVVNIITKNPLFDDVDTIEGDIGINGLVRGAGAVTFQNDDKWGLRLSAGGSVVDEDRNEYNSGQAHISLDDGRARNFSADSVLKLNDRTSMRFEVGLSDTEESVLNLAYGISSLRQDFKTIKTGITSDTDIGIIEASVYKNSLDATYDGTAPINFNNDVIVLQLSDTFKIGTDHTFRLATEYRDGTDSITLSGVLNYGVTSVNINSYSGLWSWNATDKLSLSTAVRYDHAQMDFDGTIPGTNPFTNDEYNNRYDEIGYNFGALYRLTDIDTLRFTAAKGIDLPSLFDIGFFLPIGAGVYNNPNVDASDVHDFQLGYERKVDYFNGTFKTTAFYQQINEVQAITALQNTASSTTINVGDTNVYGVEVSLDGKTDNNIRWGLNYSYSKVDDKLNITTLDFEDLNSNHMVKGNIGYSPNEKWDMDLFASYESSFEATRRIVGSNALDASPILDVDPDVIVDARVAYMPTDKWTFSLNGQALLGSNSQLTYGEETDTQVFLRAKYDF